MERSKLCEAAVRERVSEELPFGCSGRRESGGAADRHHEFPGAGEYRLWGGWAKQTELAVEAVEVCWTKLQRVFCECRFYPEATEDLWSAPSMAVHCCPVSLLSVFS